MGGDDTPGVWGDDKIYPQQMEGFQGAIDMLIRGLSLITKMYGDFIAEPEMKQNISTEDIARQGIVETSSRNKISDYFLFVVRYLFKS